MRVNDISRQIYMASVCKDAAEQFFVESLCPRLALLREHVTLNRGLMIVFVTLMRVATTARRSRGQTCMQLQHSVSALCGDRNSAKRETDGRLREFKGGRPEEGLSEMFRCPQTVRNSPYVRTYVCVVGNHRRYSQV